MSFQPPKHIVKFDQINFKIKFTSILGLLNPRSLECDKTQILTATKNILRAVTDADFISSRF